MRIIVKAIDRALWIAYRAMVLCLLAATATAAPNSCTVSATSLAFGVYTPGMGPLYSSNTIQVACATSGAVYAIGGSTGASLNSAQRLLFSGTNALQYNLYVNGSYSGIWGDGTNGTNILVGYGAGLNNPSRFTIYGLLPDNVFNQAAVPGSYSDTITVVVSF